MTYRTAASRATAYSLEAMMGDIELLARDGRAASLGCEASLSGRAPGWDRAALTRPAFWDSPGVVNVDNALVTATRVNDEAAIVLAIAHGNYKDEGCAYASAAAVSAFAEELQKPLLADADVAPAIRRAILGADERIEHIANGPMREGSQVDTAFGRRHSLRGIGASAMVLVATRAHVWLGHVGENRAFLIARGGVAKELALAHTLGNDAAYRVRAEHETDLRDVVLQVLGCGGESGVRIDVTRVAVSAGDCLVIGNASLERVDRHAPEGAAAMCTRLADAMIAKRRDVPASVAVAHLH